MKLELELTCSRCNEPNKHMYKCDICKHTICDNCCNKCVNCERLKCSLCEFEFDYVDQLCSRCNEKECIL